MRCKFAAGGPTVHSVAAVFNPNDALPKALKLVVDGIPVVLCMCKGKHLALKMCNIRLLTKMNILTALHIVDRVAQPIDAAHLWQHGSKNCQRLPSPCPSSRRAQQRNGETQVETKA